MYLGKVKFQSKDKLVRVRTSSARWMIVRRGKLLGSLLDEEMEGPQTVLVGDGGEKGLDIPGEDEAMAA